MQSIEEIERECEASLWRARYRRSQPRDSRLRRMRRWVNELDAYAICLVVALVVAGIGVELLLLSNL